VELCIVTSGARGRDRSSVGASEGRADVMRWVGVDGGDGDMSSGGTGIGGGEGLGCSRWGADVEVAGLGSWRMASAGTGIENMLLWVVGGRMIIISEVSGCRSRGADGLG
jgi:hypothetical protein